MLLIDAREAESIDKALKKYKKKYDKTNVMKELRRRKEFVKPSITNRQGRIKAAYIQRLRDSIEI